MSESLNFELKGNRIIVSDDAQAIKNVFVANQEVNYKRYKNRIEINLDQNDYFLDEEIRFFDKRKELIKYDHVHKLDVDVWEQNVLVINSLNGNMTYSRIPEELLDETKYARVFNLNELAKKQNKIIIPSEIDFNYKGQQINARISVEQNEFLNTVLDEAVGIAVLILKKRKSSKFHIVESDNLEIKQKVKYRFNISSFLQDELENSGNGRWDLFLLVSNNNIDWKLKKVYFSDDLPILNQERYIHLFRQDNPTNFNYKGFQLYLTKNRNFALSKNTMGNLIKERYQINPVIENYQKNKNTFKLVINLNNLSTSNFKFTPVIIQRNPDEFNERILDIQIDQKNASKLIVSTQVVKLNLIALYWDMYLKIQLDGEQFYLRVAKATENVKYKISQQPIRQQIAINNDIFYPYLTKRGSLSFVFRHRESFENTKNYFIEHVAYWYVKFFGSHLQKKQIWIGYEKMAQSAHDSGYHFFNYVYQNKLKDDYYYVIDKTSPEYHFLADKKERVLPYMSFKYFVYLFAADTLISSDTRRNAYNLLQRQTPMGRVIANKKLVYLQHGVNGIKKVKDFYKSAGQFDLVMAPSEWEKKHLAINEWGFDDNEVVATGLPRWDVMENQQAEINFKQIFVMPTWRNWMAGMPDDLFKQSEFYLEYQAFLNNPRLKAILKAHNARIAFFMHPKFKDYIHLFDIDTTIIDAYEFLEVPMDEMIMKSSLMISDYSSVLWEMFYLKKPTIFYQFDQEKYLTYEGSSLDFTTELFGDVTFSATETIDKIAEYINNDFQEKDEFASMREKYFNLMDKNNSKRVYQAILAKQNLIHSQTKLGMPARQAINLFIKRKIPYLKKVWRRLF